MNDTQRIIASLAGWEFDMYVALGGEVSSRQRRLVAMRAKAEYLRPAPTRWRMASLAPNCDALPDSNAPAGAIADSRSEVVKGAA